MLVPAPGRLPAGCRVYAIGDVHGCDDRLATLHAIIAADLLARPVERPLLVHLGDYVDRGPDSAGVVARLAAGDPVAGTETVNLMGNHERTMLEALAGERAAGTDWLIHGGRMALASWGVDPDGPRERWRDGIPEAHITVLARLAPSHREGGYFFAHAGVRPGVPLVAQTRDDLLGIRQTFLTSDADFGAVVVHGHTPKPKPVVRANRIGIDTGAVFGGPLTCVVLEGAAMGFLTT